MFKYDCQLLTHIRPYSFTFNSEAKNKVIFPAMC